MRTFLSTLILSAALLAVTSLVGGATSAASNPFHGADVFGVGAGKRAGPSLGSETKFDLSAHMGTPGQSDFGHVSATNDVANFSVYVDVDCVKVFGLAGNGGAWISGVVRRVSPVPNPLGVAPGDRETFFASDGGQPSAGTVDAFYFDVGETVNCKSLPPGTLPPNVTQGNITIDLG